MPTIPQRIASAFAVLCGRYGDVTTMAQDREQSRQSLYREAEQVADAVDGTAAQARIDELQQQLAQREAEVQALQERLKHAVEITPDKQHEFATVAQAEGVSLSVARRLLRVVEGPRSTPSVATLGRATLEAGKRAGGLLEVLDEAARPEVEQAHRRRDFFGRQPVLMVVEPESLCWMTGRMVEARDGVTWAEEFARFPALEAVVRDDGTGLGKGVKLERARRRAAGLPDLDDTLDVFHTLREGGRALRKTWGVATRALERADAAQKDFDRLGRQGQSRQGHGAPTNRLWRQAERLWDQAAAAEAAWKRARSAFEFFTPEGRLNDRAQAEAIVAAALPHLSGEAWAKTRRLLLRRESFTFLDQVQGRLAELGLDPDVLSALLDLEGLRRQPWRLSAATRAWALVRTVQLTKACPDWRDEARRVGAVLRGVWRASSLVECVNSVARMQQARHRKMTQGLLDLKRLYWNLRRFRIGRRKDQTPYGLLGLDFPELSFWEFLKLTPEELREKLSAQKDAA